VLVAGLAAGTAACGSNDDDAAAAADATPTTMGVVQPTASAAPGVRLLDAPAASAYLQATPGVQIIDVRTPEEFAAGHLAGAQLIDIQGAGFTEKLDALDRNTPYFVYCRSGNRSAVATAQMQEMGFTNVAELQDGINAWTAAGLPVTNA
jgi:rhodanese-related sulfurtransferase